VAELFQLDRLYFGTLVGSADPPGVIAHTPNLTPAQVAECLRLAPLAPLAPADDMPGALGLFRGDTIDFILTKSQFNDANLPQVLYILVPLAVLRALGGNVLSFRSLALTEMPSFSASKFNLVPYEFRDPVQLTDEEQTNSLNDLLLYCQDSFKNVEGILSGLVQGLPLAIVNSPASLDKRLRFVQGLLCLLPVPARIGITFATHVKETSPSPAQIKFFSQSVPPSNHLVYDWNNGKLLTPAPDDSYSRYIIAQLRLDPSLVIEQTAQLSRTAVWRAMHKENLSQALKWVSHRAAIDEAVRNNQPADRETVAAILREDPTLSDELRLAYTRHLLAFALALNEPESADLIPTSAVANQALATAVTEQLQAAAQHGGVYHLLDRWVLRVPESASPSWITLLHKSAQHHLNDLLQRPDPKPALEFLAHLRALPPALRFAEVMSDLVLALQVPARSNPTLARELFLLAVESMPPGELFRLLGDAELVCQLPEPTQVALSHLQPEPRHPAPPHVLDMGARVFGDGRRMLILARLAEWAMYLRRSELVDTGALQALLVMAQSPQIARFETLIQHIIEDFSEISILRVLEPPGPRVLVQLLLHTHEYDRAAVQLEFYQNTLFGPERLDEFTKLASEIFLMTPLSNEELTIALKQFEGDQLRSEPRAMIYCAALINRQWAADQEYPARRLTTLLFNDSNLIRTIGHENALKLLQFYARAHNALDALRIGSVLVDYAIQTRNTGAPLVTQVWSSLRWNTEVSDAALELLRRFIRVMPLSEVPKLTAYFTQTLGAPIGEALQAATLMRLVLTDSGLMRFADDVHITVHLLFDLATTYHSQKELPPKHRLRRDLDTMTGGLSEEERQRIAANVSQIVQQVFDLGQKRTRARNKASVAESFVHAQALPQTGVDLLFFIGGHFSQRKIFSLNLERESMTHIFGNRSAAMFLRETDAMIRLLNGLQAADLRVFKLSIKALSAELDSLWASLSLYNQRRIQDQFAEDCQHLADIIGILSDQINERVLSATGIGHQLETGQRLPETGLEAMRWIYGYFARKHPRG